MPTDNVLKLYSETIQSSYLHYGYWDDPKNVEIDRITVEDIRNAQERYIENLASFIPDDVKSVLDVGCGIGGNTEFLLSKGYKVEALSPDDFQRSVISRKFKNRVPFHHCRFEQFQFNSEFDLILESESACYIKINEGFSKARKVLRLGGYLLASDYFVHFKDGSKSPHLKSSHDIEGYLSSASANGFELLSEFDQTENTMPTLDYGKYLVDRYMNPTIDYAISSAKKHYPFITYLLQKMFGKKLKLKKNQAELIDSKLFRKYRKYMIFLFKKI